MSSDSQTHKPCRIISLVSTGTNAYVLTAEYPHAWTPGEMVSLAITPDDAPRLYSIAGGSSEASTIRILFTTVEDGLITPRLSRMAAGEHILLSPPRGEFRDVDGPAVWIANGTGVAPFMAMHQAAGGRFSWPKILVHGARTGEDCYNSDVFLEDSSNFRYVPCCSRPDTAGESPLSHIRYPGRLTSWLDSWLSGDSVKHMPEALSGDSVKHMPEALSGGPVEHMPEALSGGPVEHMPDTMNGGPAEFPDATYLLCGSEQMILQVRQRLLAAGIAFERIISEIYF